MMNKYIKNTQVLCYSTCSCEAGINAATMNFTQTCLIYCEAQMVTTMKIIERTHTHTHTPELHPSVRQQLLQSMVDTKHIERDMESQNKAEVKK